MGESKGKEATKVSEGNASYTVMELSLADVG